MSAGVVIVLRSSLVLANVPQAIMLFGWGGMQSWSAASANRKGGLKDCSFLAPSGSCYFLIRPAVSWPNFQACFNCLNPSRRDRLVMALAFSNYSARLKKDTNCGYYFQCSEIHSAFPCFSTMMVFCLLTRCGLQRGPSDANLLLHLCAKCSKINTKQGLKLHQQLLAHQMWPPMRQIAHGLGRHQTWNAKRIDLWH